MTRPGTIRPLLRWIFSGLAVATIILWFSVFPVKTPFALNDILFEGLFLAATIGVYVFASRLDNPLFEAGAGFFFFGFCIDLLDEFTREPDLLNTEIEGAVKLLGIALIVIGLHVAYRQHEGELARARNREEEITNSEQRYRTLAESAEDGIMLIDAAGMIQYINRNGARLAGRLPEEATGVHLSGVFSKEAADAWMPLLESVLATGNPGIDERQIPFAAHISWIEMRMIPVPVGTAGKAQILGVVRNITPRKNFENALRQANHKLNLLSSITRHDVSNQLSVVIGYLDLLIDMVTEQPAGSYIGKANQAAHRVLDLIAFTRDYQDIGITSPTWQDVAETIRRAVGQSVIPPEITVTVDIDNLWIFADPLLEKVFYNCIDNAVRHAGSFSRIAFFADMTAREAVIVCEDDGAGIPDHEKNRIFERYFGKNTGNGLFLTREILSITGISIAETGEPGKGARFEIRVPSGTFCQKQNNTPE